MALSMLMFASSSYGIMGGGVKPPAGATGQPNAAAMRGKLAPKTATELREAKAAQQDPKKSQANPELDSRNFTTTTGASLDMSASVENRIPVSGTVKPPKPPKPAQPEQTPLQRFNQQLNSVASSAYTSIASLGKPGVRQKFVDSVSAAFTNVGKKAPSSADFKAFFKKLTPNMSLPDFKALFNKIFGEKSLGIEQIRKFPEETRQILAKKTNQELAAKAPEGAAQIANIQANIEANKQAINANLQAKIENIRKRNGDSTTTKAEIQQAEKQALIELRQVMEQGTTEMIQAQLQAQIKKIEAGNAKQTTKQAEIQQATQNAAEKIEILKQGIKEQFEQNYGL